MATDSERREVARRLRYAWTNVPDRDPVRHQLRVLLKVYEEVGLDGGESDAIDLFDRLADLIDPDCEEGRYSVARTVRPVDRDALLKLAKFLQAMGERSDEKGRYDLGITFTSIADRIRGALGEGES